MAMAGHHALVDGQLGELGPGLKRHAGGDHEHRRHDEHARVLQKQSPQAEALALLGALLLGEGDVGLAVVGLLGQEGVHPVLELRGDPPEGEPRGGRRAGASTAPEHARAPSPSAEAHQVPRCPGSEPLRSATSSAAAASGSAWARTSA